MVDNVWWRQRQSQHLPNFIKPTQRCLRQVDGSSPQCWGSRQHTQQISLVYQSRTQRISLVYQRHTQQPTHYGGWYLHLSTDHGVNKMRDMYSKEWTIESTWCVWSVFFSHKTVVCAHQLSCFFFCCFCCLLLLVVVVFCVCVCVCVCACVCVCVYLCVFISVCVAVLIKTQTLHRIKTNCNEKDKEY